MIAATIIFVGGMAAVIGAGTVLDETFWDF